MPAVDGLCAVPEKTPAWLLAGQRMARATYFRAEASHRAENRMGTLMRIGQHSFLCLSAHGAGFAVYRVEDTVRLAESALSFFAGHGGVAAVRRCAAVWWRMEHNSVTSKHLPGHS